MFFCKITMNKRLHGTIYFLVILHTTCSTEVVGDRRSNSDTVKNTTERENLELPSINVYIGGVTIENFREKYYDLETLVISYADAYCHINYILQRDYHLSLQNVIFGNFRNCPSDWSDASHCIKARFAIQFDISPYYLDTNNLTNLWKQIEGSSKFKELGLQPYEPKSQNTLVIILLVIAAIFVIAILIFTFFNRKNIKKLCSSSENRTENPQTKGSAAVVDSISTISRSEVLSSKSTGNCNEPQANSGTLRYVPVFFDTQKNQKHPTQCEWDHQKNTSNILQKRNPIQNTGFSINGHINNSGKYTSQVSKEEIVDDFDSDDEINFPSPLKAPTIPPRPIKKDSWTSQNEKNNMHYMVTQITY